jgi:hypothetical protein
MRSLGRRRGTVGVAGRGVFPPIWGIGGGHKIGRSAMRAFSHSNSVLMAILDVGT